MRALGPAAALLVLCSVLAGCTSSPSDDASKGNTTFLGVIGISHYSSGWKEATVKAALTKAGYNVTDATNDSISATNTDGWTSVAHLLPGDSWEWRIFIAGTRTAGLSADEASNRAVILWASKEHDVVDQARTFDATGNWSHDGIIQHAAWVS